MRRTLLIRLVARLLLPHLGAQLAATYLLLLFAFVQLDAMVDWRATGRLMAELPPLAAAGVWSGLCLLWALEARKALARSVLRPDLELLWRQPLTVADWGLALLLPTALAALPLAAVGALVSPGHGIFAGLGAAVAALGVAVGGRGLAMALGSISAVGLAGAAAAALPALAVPLGVLSIPAALWALGWLATFARPLGAPATRSSPFRPRGPLSALSLRDLLCLWRTERAVAVGCLLVSAPAWAVQSAVQENWPLSGAPATTAALVVLAVFSTMAAAAIAAMTFRLGATLDPAHTPVSAHARAGTLVASGTALMSPVVAALILSGTGSSLTGWARLIGLAVALAAGAVVLSATQRSVVRRAHMTGTWLWWMMLAMALSILPPPWGLTSSITLAVAAWALTGAVLHRRRQWPAWPVTTW